MMKISLNWLSDYIDLKGISLDEIVDKISTAGLEIEEIIDQSKKLEKMVVGFVKEKKKHPNADKLSVCIVNDGKEDFNVVCGAPNVEQGQKIAFAKVGAVIPSGGMKLEKAKIRGEVSFGMICSERELEISDNHEGIIVLDPSLKEGTELSKALGMDDIILDVAITPNRADALSHIGIARDLAAIFNRPFKYPEIKFEESKKQSDQVAAVEIVDAVNCPRYVGKVVEDVEIKESPEWLKIRLKSIGLRPINNVVDVTNFVLHEVGQPLHAFDLENLGGKKIIVRAATEGEKFVTLDSKERKLSSSDLMICDGEKPVAVAGVMGGENSEVTSTTKNILIESAYFNPSSVRKTAKKLGLSTDASYRFERGTDYGINVWAARRAAQLIQQTAGGEILSGEIDAYPNPFEPRSCSVRYERITRILGYEIPNEIVKNIFVNLGFAIKEENKNTLTLLIPSWRHDIEREIDLIEEAARIYGYDKVPDVHKVSSTLEEKVDQSAFNDNLRNTLTSLGFFEIVTNSLLKDETAERFGKPIKVMNPQSSEMSHLRPSLIPGMLQAVSNNLKVGEKNLQLFEIGNVFEINHEGELKSFDDFSENENIIIAVTGYQTQTEWYEKDRQFDYYDLKGITETFLIKILPGTAIKYNVFRENTLLEQGSNIEINGIHIGTSGKIKNEMLNLYDVNQQIFLCVLDIGTLKKIPQQVRSFRELLKYPKVYRDFAFLLDRSIGAQEVIEVIKTASSKLLHHIKLFDIFQSDSLGVGKKSLAFQLEYFDSSRTLTEDEVDKDFRNAIKAVEQKFNAQLRGV